MGIKVQKPSVHESAIKLPPMAAECLYTSISSNL